MNDPSDSPSEDEKFDEYRRIVAAVGGGYLCNTIRDSGVTCAVCTTPVDSYSLCYRCNEHARAACSGGHELARLVVPLVYGIAGRQSGFLMRQYKGPASTTQQRSRLTLLLAFSITRHGRCVEAGAGQEISAWTTIPSTSGRLGAHPIRAIAAQAQPASIELTLTASNPPISGRDYLPERWRVQTPELVKGRHVLVIDDTWTTGGHAQSAASALIAAGATATSIVVLARWLDPNYRDNANFISTRLAVDWDPNRCPVSGGACA